IDSYRIAGKNKELLDAIKKYVAMEKTKKEDDKRSQAIVKKAKEQTEKRKQLKRNREAVKVGATVRLENTKQVGTVMDIDKGIATVAIGNFKTKVDVNRLIAIP
ncbi:MAG: MutS2/Smr-associated SH3 domain-containing protein, partial [Flavobacteriales bacterium]